MTGEQIRQSARRGGRIVLLLTCGLISGVVSADPPTQNSPRISSPGVGSGGYSQRQKVIADLPLNRLNQTAQQRILSIVQSPTIYRRLPTQAVDCDRDMFLFLTRNPEVLVGLWDLMGITQVQTERTGPYKLDARDGSGTQCKIDLVYGDPNLHLFVADGNYDGKLVARPIHGSSVFVLRNTFSEGQDGRTTIHVKMDCFIQMDHLGADLVARTMSGLIGRSADHNFTETARFVAQISQASERNPAALLDVARRLPQVSEPTKRSFVNTITTVARRSESRFRTAHREATESESQR